MELIMELIMKLAHGADNEAGTKKGKTAVLWSRVRKLIERGEASRESTHLDLYLQAMIPDVSNRLSSPVSYTFRRAQFSGNKPEHKIPSGACYAYHSMRYYREGAKCTCKHKCYNNGCYGNHSAARWGRSMQPPYNIMPTFLRGQRPFHRTLPPSPAQPGRSRSFWPTAIGPAGTQPFLARWGAHWPSQPHQPITGRAENLYRCTFQ